MKLDYKALKKSFFATLAKLISVFLGAGSGTIIHDFMGNSLGSLGVAAVMAITALIFMWFAEYHHEID